MRSPVLAGALAAAAFAATACGSTTGGTAVTAASGAPSSSAAPTVTVPAGLDTGTFPTTLYQPKTGDVDTAWVAEGNRMADVIVSPTDIDPKLTMGGAALRAYPVLSGTQLVDRVPDATMTVFSVNGMKVGNTATRGDTFDNPTRALRIGMYRFDSDADAAKVVSTLKDRTSTKPQFTLTSAPGSTASEFKPGTVDSYTAVGPIVINVSATAPTSAAAADLANKAYDKQLPAAKAFKPTPTADILKAPVDTDGILARTLPAKMTTETDILSVGVVNLQGLTHKLRDSSKITSYADAGVDLVAMNDGVLYRTKDNPSATTLQTFFKTSTGPTPYVQQAGVAQIPSIACIQDTSRPANFQYRCTMTNGRYLAELTGGDLKTAQQKATAQWVILAKNP